jgi:hypothetical protein
VEHKSKLWARVARFDARSSVLNEESGYLFAAYLECDGDVAQASDDLTVRCTVADPTGTPLNIRDQPGGSITGTVRNGEVVRVFGSKLRNGKRWAHAYRSADDNAVGWVFDDYLKCEEDGH